MYVGYYINDPCQCGRTRHQILRAYGPFSDKNTAWGAIMEEVSSINAQDRSWAHDEIVCYDVVEYTTIPVDSNALYLQARYDDYGKWEVDENQLYSTDELNDGYDQVARLYLV